MNFIQYELWKDCSNNCEFCFAHHQPPVNKLQSIKQISRLLDDPEVKEFDTIGFMGGEFFVHQLDDPEVKKGFYSLIDKVINLLNTSAKQFCITATLIQKDLSPLLELLSYLNKHRVLDRCLVCTSYDTYGRFKIPKAEELWAHNVQVVKTWTKVHIEMIVTQDLIEKMLDNQFDLPSFVAQYGPVDFLEPSTGFEDPETFCTRLPKFLCKRADFIQWVYRFCIQEQIINLDLLLNPRLRSNVCYYHIGQELVRFSDRHIRPRDQDLPIKPKYCYSDSQTDMQQDLEVLRTY